MMNMKILSKHTIGLVAVIVMMAAMLILVFGSNNKQTLPQNIRDVAMQPPISLSDIDLYDDSKRSVSRDQFTGRWSLVTFGYTHCPDICPATLSQMGMLYKLFREQAGIETLPQMYFVSVDPHRDAAEYLGDYTRYFDQSFIGVSGNEQALVNFEKQFGVYHRYQNQPGSDNYIVEHSADIFLIDPQARIVASFQPPMNLRQVASQFTGFVKYYAGNQG